MRVQFHGCGDAFGSGGRFNTCFQVIGERINFLMDCGASSLIALKANKAVLNDIRTVLITHFHADHFGGIPFFVLDAQFFSKRDSPLTVAGPPGLEAWFERVMETSFPGSSRTKQRFEIALVELEQCRRTSIDGLQVTAYPVKHGNPGGPSFAYRVEAEDRIVAYTGDTEWTNTLIEAGRGADLFIAEAYFYDKKVKFHLDYATLQEHLSLIEPKRLVLTHMSDDMLPKSLSVPHELAEDGMVLEL